MTDVAAGTGRLAHAPADHPPVKAAKIGILLANLGTPDGYDYWSMRRYLSEFLSDKRVVDIPDWKWQPLLQLIILSKRPFTSGATVSYTHLDVYKRQFQFRQRVGHRPARDVKRPRQLRRGAFLVQTGKVVQHREMRKLHPLGQRLGDAVAGQLIGHEQLTKQRNGKFVIALCHGPVNSRSWWSEGMRARARVTSARSRSCLLYTSRCV